MGEWLSKWRIPKTKPVEERLGKVISKRKLFLASIKFQFEDSSTKRLWISEELLPYFELEDMGRIVFHGKRFKQFKRF